VKNPERRAAAILYAELRNFTRLSEVLQPDKVLGLANEFFALVAKSVLANTGKVLAVHNDTLLAAFAAGEAKQFCSMGLQAAQAVQAQFGAIGERWQQEYGLPAAVALGLHTGEAVFGTAGPQNAQQLVALGDCISVAERLVHRARAGEIVLSVDAVKALATPLSELGAEQLPSLELGGKRPPLAIFGLVLETRLDFT
jgi:adenylate cyclase